MLKTYKLLLSRRRLIDDGIISWSLSAHNMEVEGNCEFEVVHPALDDAIFSAFLRLTTRNMPWTISMRHKLAQSLSDADLILRDPDLYKGVV